jgi:hypothetical protein
MGLDFRTIELQLDNEGGFGRYVAESSDEGLSDNGAMRAVRDSYDIWCDADERKATALHLVRYLDATPSDQGGYQVLVWRERPIDADELAQMRRFIAEMSPQIIMRCSFDAPHALEETKPDKLAVDLLFKAAFGSDVHVRVLTAPDGDPYRYQAIIYVRIAAKEYCLPIIEAKGSFQQPDVIPESA